jgi:hypothetical protein
VFQIVSIHALVPPPRDRLSLAAMTMIDMIYGLDFAEGVKELERVPAKRLRPLSPLWINLKEGGIPSPTST